MLHYLYGILMYVSGRSNESHYKSTPPPRGKQAWLLHALQQHCVVALTLKRYHRTSRMFFQPSLRMLPW